MTGSYYQLGQVVQRICAGSIRWLPYRSRRNSELVTQTVGRVLHTEQSDLLFGFRHPMRLYVLRWTATLARLRMRLSLFQGRRKVGRQVIKSLRGSQGSP